MNLYEISNEIASILEDAEAELTPEMLESLNNAEMAFETKADNVLRYRQGLISQNHAIKDEIARLKEKADRLERKAEWLRKYLLGTMNMLKIKRLTTPLFNAAVVAGPLKAELEGDDIPEEYARVKTVKEFNKTKAINAWKEGVIMPDGVLITQTDYLKVS